MKLCLTICLLLATATSTAFASGECAQYARTHAFDVCAQTLNTYHDAFGRAPSADEIKYWIGRDIMSYDQLIGNHRIFLKSDQGEREATIRRSYQTAFNRQPTQAEVNYWSARVQQSGNTYAELLGFHKQYQPAPAAPAAPAVATAAASDAISNFHLDRSGNLLDSQNRVVAPSGDLSLMNASGQIIAQGGGNIIAQGGGNIIAQGGGNLVGNSGGTMVARYGIQSTDGKKSYEIKLADGRKIIVKK